MNKFWQSEANKFTLYGAIFGFLFPIIATLLRAFLKHGDFSIDSMFDVQMTDPLLWIIDSAPFWLGLFARFAGRRQDNLKAIIRQSNATELGLSDEQEDSQQFAGLLTFLGIGLIGIVLFAFSIWLQRLILSGGTPPASEAAVVATVDESTAGNGIVGGGALATATIAPVVINVQPTVVAFTPTSIPPTFTALPPTETPAVVIEPTAVVEPTATAVVAPETGNADAGNTEASNPDASNTETNNTETVAEAENDSEPVEPAPSNLIILGFVQRDLDCRFFTELAAESWQTLADVSVEIRPYADATQLFDELTAAPNSGTLFITNCFVDPDDRPYLRQHISQLQIIGKAFWGANDKKLLTVSNAGTPSQLRRQFPAIYNFIVNQTYDDAQITAQDPAGWLQENRATVQSWMNN
ncbi:MAG: hypothetical protein KDE54_34795 [Caldilineaceae bacterium]|nr:hypothetical protein [Caldilineaceae bacterium]MCB0095808.1 hypothetical protein [Caldilineaceae bacterium]MCB0140719.1 hypothetical protein [Caldilineaceae bacterium]